MNFKLRTITLFAVISFTMLSCGKKEEKTEESLRPVRYEVVSNSASQKIRTFSGSAATDKIIPLSFRNSGIVTELNLELGQIVKEGQLLAKLDNVQARLSYESSVEDLNSAASAMNTSKLSLNRIKTLYEKGSTSLSDYESAKNSYVTGVASYESAKRSVKIQEEKIRYGYLVAPENGVISNVGVEVEENVSSGQEIAVLNAGTNMQIKLGLPESVINGVVKNMEVEVSFSSLENEIFKGEVSEISPAIDVNTSTYPIKVRIINPSSKIKTGMSANVSFEFDAVDNNSNIIIVTPKAVGEDGKGRFVFLISDNGTHGIATKKYVEIGNLTADGFEIISGLKSGDKIATAGLQTLLDGQNVKLTK